MRIVFMGTAELACRPLDALFAKPEFKIVAVVTQPDRPRGRDLRLQPSPVKARAIEHKLPVLQPDRARDPAFIAELQRLAPELIVVVAYGQILPQSILDLPQHGALNVHTSLLPKYRGAAPIQWAILNGDQQTGVTIMKMDAGLDTGPILAQEPTRISDEDTSQTLHDRLAAIGAGLLVATIPEFVSGKIAPQSQPIEGASYARKITKEDGQIDWSQPARIIHNRVRAFVPWPGAYTWRMHGSKRTLLKIWSSRVVTRTSGSPGEVTGGPDALVVGSGDGALEIIELQREGSRRMTAAQYLAGHPMAPGEHLG